ncbi:alpha/beta hydrolase [Pseudomonas sp. GCM10022186]|uniref:alpha/beta hydrolase n=1 Tax=Pseudomonas sp. GCM10022186 TaxID=3252650 RepID=UPI0036241021
MKHTGRTSLELKIALAILNMNTSVRDPHKRLISSSQLILCWRNAPHGTFIETVESRIVGKAKHERFKVLIKRSQEIKITRHSKEVALILSGKQNREQSISSVVREPRFQRLVKNSFSAPSDLISEGRIRITSAPKDTDSHARLGDTPREVVHYSGVPAQNNYTTYTIFFGTDRLLESQRSVKFGGFRSDDKVSYGVAKVSIPHIHKEGKLERPTFLFRILKDNPNKHIVVHTKALLDLEAWFESAKKQLATVLDQQSNHKEGLLFIHGYNVGFEEALWRSAQLRHDLKFPGLMLCFSWASLGSTKGYPADEATVDWSASNLKEYLTNVTQNLGLSALHIVAHSMGNRALLAVLENWENKPGATPISQIILAAPDVDAKRFKQFGRVFNLYEQVTLYASRHDRAIAASQLVHSYPRAGGANPPLVMDHLSTIDVSSAGKDMFGLGHSYVAEVSKIFRDLFYIVRHRHKPDQRAGITKKEEGYWELT